MSIDFYRENRPILFPTLIVELMAKVWNFEVLFSTLDLGVIFSKPQISREIVEWLFSTILGRNR